MNWPDIVNGLYESFASFFLLLSCFRLYRDKEVKGWSMTTQLFFTTWGYWNLWYYPHLNQWVSFTGGLFVVLTNTAWTSMAIYYTHKNKKKRKKKKKILHG